jgi:hypothetical protein
MSTFLIHSPFFGFISTGAPTLERKVPYLTVAQVSRGDRDGAAHGGANA